MSRRWSRILRQSIRKLLSRCSIAAVFFTTAAIAAANQEPSTSVDAPVAHADIVTRIAAVRLAIEKQQGTDRSTDEPPARVLQWNNWPNWNNWRNWNNWPNWGNWNNY